MSPSQLVTPASLDCAFCYAMAPKGPQDHAPSYYTQSAGPYGQPGQANPYMPGASYGQPANDPYAQHSMPDPYALNSGQVHNPTRLLILQAAPEAT